MNKVSENGEVYESATEGSRDSDFMKDADDSLKALLADNMKTLVRDIQYDAIKDRVKYLLKLRSGARDRVIIIQADLERAQAEEKVLTDQVNQVAAGDLTLLDRQTQKRCRACDTTFDEFRTDGHASLPGMCAAK